MGHPGWTRTGRGGVVEGKSRCCSGLDEVNKALANVAGASWRGFWLCRLLGSLELVFLLFLAFGAPAWSVEAGNVVAVEAGEPFSILAPVSQEKSKSRGSRDSTGRWFRALEAQLIGLYSRRGMPGIPEGSEGVDHFLATPRPPKNLVGFETIHVFGERTRWGLGSLRLRAMDLHLRAVYDPRPQDLEERFRMVAGDFWVRLQPEGNSRMSVRLGHFLVPYGLNPILSPRGLFFLPAEAEDLGFKRDWGVEWKGPAGRLDYVVAATLGAGEGFHLPSPGAARNGSYLFSGRLGSPNYRDFQLGVSGAVGRLPVLMAERKLTDLVRTRWRTGMDVFYRYLVHTVFAGQVFFGRDGPFPLGCPEVGGALAALAGSGGSAGARAGVARPSGLGAGARLEASLPGQETLAWEGIDAVWPEGISGACSSQMGLVGGRQWREVLGGMAQVMWVVPGLQNLGLGARFLALARDLEAPDPWAVKLTLEAEWSISNSASFRVDWVHQFAQPGPPGMAMEDDQVYFGLYYYGWDF